MSILVQDTMQVQDSMSVQNTMPEQDATLMQAKGISKAFGSLQVLRDIDLALIQGEILTLLGPSGCGKESEPRFFAGSGINHASGYCEPAGSARPSAEIG